MSDQFDPRKHLTKLKDKEYLEVRWRIVWFRSVVEGGSIQTELINLDPIVVKASIINGDGHVIATGMGSAARGGNAVWKGREIEKAETAAIGRALAHAGYGTQFTGEDESDHLADSPQTRQSKPDGAAAWAEHGAMTVTSQATARLVRLEPTKVRGRDTWYAVFTGEDANGAEAYYEWRDTAAIKATFPDVAEWFADAKAAWKANEKAAARVLPYNVQLTVSGKTVLSAVVTELAFTE